MMRVSFSLFYYLIVRREEKEKEISNMYVYMYVYENDAMYDIWRSIACMYQRNSKFDQYTYKWGDAAVSWIGDFNSLNSNLFICLNEQHFRESLINIIYLSSDWYPWLFYIY
jgi:hypothetical protein